MNDEFEMRNRLIVHAYNTLFQAVTELKEKAGISFTNCYIASVALNNILRKVLSDEAHYTDNDFVKIQEHAKALTDELIRQKKERHQESDTWN